MRDAAIDLLLLLGVLSAWLGALGLLRLRTALDRLHCATFVNVSGAFFVLAVFVGDGFSDRAWKTLLLFAAMLIGGAATGHAVGRALVTRERSRP